jgi:putative inorganic carbon (HCO3(-)) transporter
MEEDFVVWYLTSGREATGDDALYRVFSFFTNPLEFGVFMVLVYPFALLRFLTPQTIGKRLLNGLFLVIILSGLLVSFSRGPTLGLICVTIFLAFPVKQVRYWIAAGSAAITVTLMLAWPWVGQQITERIQGSENVTVRIKLWENALKIMADNPVIGIGYGNYVSRHVETLRTNQIGPLYQFAWDRIEKIGTIESIFLSLAAETGIIGLIAFFSFIIALFVVGRRVLKTSVSQSGRTIVLSCLAAVFGFLVCGITVAHNIQYTPAILFFGLMMSSVVIVARDQDQSQQKR